MFDSLKKYFKKENPEFNSLKNFPQKNKFFYRIAAWDWLTEKEIHIYDPHNPRIITLDDWPQLVFLDANGKLTVSEYVEYMISCYKVKVPKELDAQIIHELNSLLELKLIAYADTETKVDEKFDKPMSKQKNY